MQLLESANSGLESLHGGVVLGRLEAHSLPPFISPAITVLDGRDGDHEGADDLGRRVLGFAELSLGIK